MKRSAQTVLQEGMFYTIAAANGRVLEVADFNTENGASVRLWSYEGQPWQQWSFEETADGQYRIRNRFTGKVMDLAMSGVVNGTWVHQWSATTGAGQRWEVVPAGSGVKLHNVLADKVLDLVGLRMDNGTQAQIWQDVNGETRSGGWNRCRTSCWKKPRRCRSPAAPPSRSRPAPRPARGPAPKRPAAKAAAAPPSKPKNSRRARNGARRLFTVRR